MDRLSSFSKIFLIFVWLMLGVGSAFGSECASDYAAPQENPAWDGSSKEEACTKNGFYIIDNAAKLAWFSDFVNQNKNNSAKANAKLMADLDMGGELWTPICAGTGGNKDGKTYCKYQGTFDGNGHVIKNLYINGDGLAQEDKNFAQNLGFIGVLGSGTVKNLILENVDIHATTSIGSLLGADNQISVGSFVGWMADVDNNVVEKCMVTGSIRTTGNGQGVGGIVGNAKKGTISDCLSLVEIMTSGSQAYVGGIIGIIKTDVTVTSCVYAGPGLVNIGTNGAVGGIAGNVFSGTLTTNNDYYEVNNYYEGNEINGVGKNCKTSNCTNNTEKVDISNKEEIACKLNGGKYNDATCDKTGAWSIGETTLSLFDYGVDGYKIYFYANGGKFADGSEAKNKFLDVGMTITPEDVEDPSHDDKTFIGWSLTRDATEPAENLGTVSESDTVFAVWQDKLTVTFNVSPGVFPDGNVNMKTKKMDKGAVVTVGSLGTLPTSYCKTPSSTGDGCDELLYFTGWAEKVDPVESDTIHMEDFYAYEDIALYAVWTDVETYTVTYNANGHGKTRVDYVRVGKGKMITVPVDPVAHDGYEFVGWFTDASCVNPFDFTTKIHESIILYAKWKPINYKITYEVGEGSANADNPNEYNVEETINLKAPTPATGYSFDDWFTDDAFSKKVIKIAKGSTGDKSFYAKWSTKTYRITYLADNNSYGSVSDQIKEHGSLITLLSSGIFKRNGYEQDGWATKANGAKVYDLGASYRNNADLTLFPSWKITNYTIKYVCEGCINDPDNRTEYSYETPTFSVKYKNLTPPDGFAMVGWFTATDYKTKVEQIKKGSFGDITLYAKLNKVYKITYVGVDIPYGDKTYTSEKTAQLRGCATREGYTFEGWYDNVKFEGDAVTEIPLGSTGDKTFYAKWSNNENGNVLDYHTITYVVDENDVATDVYNAGDAVALADLTKDGYALDGWYVNEEMTGIPVTNFAAGATDDKIFYAKTKSSDAVIEYTATYNLNDGTMGNESFTFTVESDDITLLTPTRNGYSFAGWLDSKTKTVITTLPKGSIGDRTLTAQWVAEKYTIAYNNLEGATNTNPTTYTIESSKIKLSGAERIGYTFEGWFNSEDNQVTEIPAGFTGDVILTAKWSGPNEYLISYNLNEGELSACTNPTTYSILTSATTLCEPTKENYDFVGWFTADDIKYEEIVGSMTGNLELTARWKASSYSITYKIGNSVENLKPNKYTVENAVTLAVPTKDGYTFDGWYENEWLIGDKVTSFAAGKTEDKAFFGQWNKNEYTITYFIDGAEADLTPSKYTVEDAVTLAVPTKDGYYFEAWLESGTNYVRTSLPEGSVGDRSFVALWSDPIEYHITYVIDGDNVDLTPSEYTVEDDVTLPTPTKKGYNFVGWFDSENKQVTEIKKGSTGDLNLTAKWSDPIEYTISYNNVEGASNTNPTNYSVISETITLADAEKDGYNFEGWFDSENNQVTEIKKGSTGDLNLTAKWSDPIEYTISYNNVENARNDNPTTYTVESDTIKLAAAVKAGYVFAGWFDKDDEEVTAIAKGSTGNIELTAKWEGPIAYTITVNVNGGTLPEGAAIPETYTVESVITLPIPTKDGYDFIGWYDGENKKVTEIANGSTGNIELTAKWSEPIKYTITYELNGGTLPEGAEIPQTYTFESDVTLPEPTKKGYTFKGWYDQYNGNIGDKISNHSFFGDITLYAKWNGPVEYTIAYNNIEGATNENPVTYTVESETIQLANAVKNGYTFEGWFDKDGKQVTEIAKGTTGNLNLTAKWSFIPIVTHNGAVTFTEYEPKKYKAEIDGEYDGNEDFSISSDIEVEYVKFNRTFKEGVPSTITLPFEIDVDKVEGAAFYTFGGIEPTNGVNMVQAYPVDTEKLPANTPYLIRPTAETIVFKGAVVFKKTEDPVVKKNNGRWEFRGVYVNKKNVSAEEEGAIYGMSISEKYPQGYFGRFRANVSWFSQMRAYMFDTQYSKPQLAKSPIGNTFSLESGGIGIHWNDGDENIDVGEKATGFHNVKSVPANIRENRTYDLKGRLIKGSPKAKGVYYNKRMNKK